MATEVLFPGLTCCPDCGWVMKVEESCGECGTPKAVRCIKCSPRDDSERELVASVEEA